MKTSPKDFSTTLRYARNDRGGRRRFARNDIACLLSFQAEVVRPQSRNLAGDTGIMTGGRLGGKIVEGEKAIAVILILLATSLDFSGQAG